MIPLFTLPLDQLRAEHVETLRREEVPESQTVEFKQTLAAKSGRTAPWLDGGDEVGDHGRNDVLKEVVAFANSGGGNVVLGIVESGDHPKRAMGVNHLPRCHELADRFRLMARDCIDPQLPSLEVCGVPMPGGDEHAGVVLFRVPPSRLAPHRIKPTKHCYLRRADRTEEMTMREIQDMSVRLARGEAAIKERLEESHQHYLSVVALWDRESVLEVGVRATVLPVGGNVHIDRVYRVEKLTLLRPTITATIDGEAQELWVPQGNVLPRLSFRPVLRGGMRITDTDERRVTAETIFSDGLVEFAYKYIEQTEAIFAHQVVALAANALLVADVARQVAGVPGAELILDVELRSDEWHNGSIARGAQFLFQPTGTRTKDLGPEPLRLPMRSVGETGEFTLALRSVLDDLRNECGLPHVEQFEIDLSAAER